MNNNLFGKYQVLEEMHAGVFCNLYKVIDESQNQTVALKMLKEEHSYNLEIVERFKREARITKELNHPNIIKVYDIGQEANRHYFTMQYITGPNLRKLLENEGILTFERVGPIAKMVCVGLHHAHTKRIYHRDIKPTNIMLDNGNAIILDFGIAKIMSLARLTLPGLRLGTPEYMAPEQILGSSIDGRTDLYSLGVVLFELLTGTVPFKGNNDIEVFDNIIKQKPPKPSELNKEITRDVDTLILKAINKDRTQRFSSGLEMANAINNILGLPVEQIKEIEFQSPILLEDKKKPVILTTSPKTFSDMPKIQKTTSIGKEFWLPPLIAIILMLGILSVIYKRTDLIPFILIFIGLISLLLIIFTKPAKPVRYSNGLLLLTIGKEIIQEFPLNTNEVTIGRDQPEGIELFKDSISRSHARIVNENGFFVIYDLNSKNGTFVNNQRIKRCVLKNNDRIEIGGEILIFQGIV